MSIEIPWTRIRQLTVRPQLFSGDQSGTLGGPSLPIPRLGDRFAVDVVTTQFKQDSESRLFMADLFESLTADGRILLRQPNRDRSLAFGQPLVDGTGQAGSVLNLRALVPGSTVRRGELFHLEHGGKLYVNMVRGGAVAGADGKIAIPIWPMLRILTSDGDRCELGAPKIEGKVTMKGGGFSANRTEPFEFSIEERA